MVKSDTGLIANLRLLYKNYGGLTVMVRSGYFWVAILISICCWPKAISGQWVELSISILPTLAGFSIAAYAVFFSVMTEKDRKALSVPLAELNNRAPFLIMASSVSHAVFIQISALILAIIFQSKPLPVVDGYQNHAKYFNLALSFFGIFLTLYGIILILACTLSIMKIIDIKSKL